MHPQPPSPAAAPQLDPIRAAIDRGLHALASLGGDLVDHANRLGAILWSPPRVVVVGRLKAGKSTLVNALIGAPVAETAALEATNVVCIYQDGAPSRAEVVHLDGRRKTLPMGSELITDFGWPTTEIAYVHRYLPSAAIRDFTLIDTPGLATLTSTNEAATTRALVESFDQTASASVDADAAVFLFDATPRQDEIDFLAKLGFTPLNTLGVLSRADGFGEGVLGQRDPLDHAHEHARVMAQRLSGSILTVLPVAGLLAETSHTGRATEADARHLASVADLTPLELFALLEADDPAPLSSQTRDRLLDLVGEYGAVCGRDSACGGGHSLNEWLTERSGITELQAVLQSTIREFADMHRAGRILTALDDLAYQHPARDAIRSITHQIRTDPAFAPVNLLRALRSMQIADPQARVVADLTQLLRGRTAAEKVGLPDTAERPQIRAAAEARVNWASERALSTSTAAEDSALIIVTQAYLLIRSQHL